MSERSTEYRGPLAIDLAEIDEKKRPASEMRVGLDIEALKEYAHVLADMPPIKLMWDRKAEQYWVVDGAHTLTVFLGTGQRIVQAMVADGNYLAAWRAAVRENGKRGVRITPADRQARLERACQILPDLDKKWPWSARQLGNFCGVHHSTAEPVLRKALARQGIDPKTPRHGSDGKTRQAAQSPSTSGSAEVPQLANSPVAEPSANGAAAAAPAPAAPPDRYADLKVILDKIRSLMATVNAADDAEQRGWGGLPAVWQGLSPWERNDIARSLGDLVDSLREWQECTGGCDEGHSDAVR